MVEKLGEIEKQPISSKVPESFRARLFNKVVSYLPNFYIHEANGTCDINTIKEVRITAAMAGTFCGMLGATVVGVSTNLFGLQVTTPLDRIALMMYAFANLGGMIGAAAYKKESKRVNEALSKPEVNLVEYTSNA